MRDLAFDLVPTLTLRPHTLGAMSVTAPRSMLAKGLWLARASTDIRRAGRITYGMDAPPTWREVFARDGESRVRLLASWAWTNIKLLFGRRPPMVTGLLVRSLRIGRLEHMFQPTHAEMFSVDAEIGLEWPIRAGERVYVELVNDSETTITVVGSLFGVEWVESDAPVDECNREVIAKMRQLLWARGKL